MLCGMSDPEFGLDPIIEDLIKSATVSRERHRRLKRPESYKVRLTCKVDAGLVRQRRNLFHPHLLAPCTQ